MDLNARLPRLDASRFAMIPRSDIPRSSFLTTHSRKSTFDAGYLVPILVKEVLPADSFHGELTLFLRLQTLLYPLMDAMTAETFFFFVPNRLVWENWRKFMGERKNPADSIDYTIPQLVSTVGGYAVGSIFDHMGLPTAGGPLGANSISHNVMPLRAYQLIYDEWFRDQNHQNVSLQSIGNGPDTITWFTLLRRNKRPDYFTTALPWPLKGGVEVTLPLSGNAPVTGIAVPTGNDPVDGNPASSLGTTGGAVSGWAGYWQSSGANIVFKASGSTAGSNPQIYADLEQATGATINALRLAFMTQAFLEKDARGGTRYTEMLRARFGVQPQDTRLQRPEYIGGGRTPIQTQAIPQTSATSGSNMLGQLSAQATSADRHSFTYNATEHGWIIGLIHVGAELTYQQGLHRKWTRTTRYDHYDPDFAHLGEQSVLKREIFAQGTATDTEVFGYQERWSEYRYEQSEVTGLFKTDSAGALLGWHLALDFASVPTLNSTFLEDVPPLSRALAAGATANGAQILMDSVFRIRSTRPMPMYSVPGVAGRL